MPSAAPAFRMDNVFAGYGETTVVRDVSLVVPGGSVVALLGPNGAGKTTLLRVASGLLRPQHGSVSFGGHRLDGLQPHDFAAAGVCHIPEGRAVFPNLTVRENLSLQHPAGAAADRVALVLEAFPRLGERLRQVAGTMSGGEQQMLALARSLIASPRIVLLDEVSMGLAPMVVAEIFGALKVLATSGISLLLVEQYVNRALEMADYVYLLGKGRIVGCGEAAEFDVDSLETYYLGGERPAATSR